jgi:hypothetical protein
MPRLLVWLVVVAVAFVGFGLLGGSALGMKRRSRFWARVLLAHLTILASVLCFAGAAALHVLPINALMLLWLMLVVAAPVAAPAFCYRPAGRATGSSDDDGGGGSGPRRPPARPQGPRGGVPLPDADQAIARVRDHNKPRLRTWEPRRRAREPAPRIPTR